MDLNPRTETFGVEDQTWLGSAHGTSAARTVTVDVSTFTEATHYPDGILPSGTLLGQITATGLHGLYDDAALDGREVLDGFLFTSQRIDKVTDADVVAPMLDHGKVKATRLPFPFANNAAAVTAQADVAGRIIFVDISEVV